MLTIETSADGVEYKAFISVSASKSLDTGSGVFSFTASVSENNIFPVANGDLVTIKADGFSIITGYVDQLESSYSVGAGGVAQHIVNVQGRDKIADIVDSSLPDAIEVEGNTTLKQIIETVIEKVGADIEVIDLANPDPFGTGEVVSSEPAENLWEFILKYSRKRSVILVSNGDGNIVITQTPEEPIATVILSETGNPNNNVKSASVRYADQERFNRYVYISQGTGFSANFFGQTSTENISNRNGEFTDSAIRASRVWCEEAETSMNKNQCADRAIWQANIRKAQAREYTATIFGHSHRDGAWTPGLQVIVSDDLLNISEKDRLLIKSVTWDFSLQGGSTSSLTCTDKDAYSLEIEEENRLATKTKTVAGIPEWQL